MIGRSQNLNFQKLDQRNYVVQITMHGKINTMNYLAKMIGSITIAKFANCSHSRVTGTTQQLGWQLWWMLGTSRMSRTQKVPYNRLMRCGQLSENTLWWKIVILRTIHNIWSPKHDYNAEDTKLKIVSSALSVRVLRVSTTNAHTTRTRYSHTTGVQKSTPAVSNSDLTWGVTSLSSKCFHKTN